MRRSFLFIYWASPGEDHPGSKKKVWPGGKRSRDCRVQFPGPLLSLAHLLLLKKVEGRDRVDLFEPHFRIVQVQWVPTSLIPSAANYLFNLGT